MVFTSFNFLIFFPLVVLIYYLFPNKYRQHFLLAASYFFYINLIPIYLLLLLGITLITYISTIWIEKITSEKVKLRLLVLNIVLILLPLFFFKYFNFVNIEVFKGLNLLGIRYAIPQIHWLLPVGISFYTFMAISYLVDVYQEEIKAERKFTVVALFLAFFPIVLSGPIERATNMFHQFKSKIVFSTNNIEIGFQLMLWGYFMKLVIADRAGILVRAIFDNPGHYSGISLFMALLLYPIQVYGDLGGYSLIAIGAAKSMGFDVMTNFRRPFFSTSMSEFWRRWHISLISWITDYIYIPLSFNLRKYKIWGIVMSLMLTFVIAGIWHGAGGIFIIWGLLQGLFLTIEAVTSKKKKDFVKKFNLGRNRIYIIISMAFTYFLFAFSELFGGAMSSTHDVFFVIKKIVTNFRGTLYYDSISTAVFLFIGIATLFISEFRREFYESSFSFFNNKNWMIRGISYVYLVVLILMIGVFDGGQFIYFKF